LAVQPGIPLTMSSVKAQKEINKAVRHLMDFISASPIWSPRFDDLMDDFFEPIAKQLNWSIDDVAAALFGGPCEHMAWDFLTEQMATLHWDDDEPKSAIADYLKTRGWREGAHGRRYLRAFAESEVRFWEVTDVEAGAWIDVRPYGTEDKSVRVLERTASQSIAKWTALAARVIPMGSERLFSGSLIPLSPEAAPRVQRVLDKVKNDMEVMNQELTNATEAEGITDDFRFNVDDESAMMFPETAFTFWAVDVMRDSVRPAPRMYNTDNEKIVVTRYRFPKIGDHSFVRDQLTNHPAMIKEEELDVWTWLRSDESNTVLGRLELRDNQLDFETNSVERGKLGAHLLQSLLGDALQKDPIVTHENLEKMAASAPKTHGFDPELQNNPEVQAVIQQHLMQHYRKTLDERIPMLDNETPRDCAADPDKQHKVINWLKTLANTDKSTPGAPQDFDWIWHELGLQEHLPQSNR